MIGHFTADELASYRAGAVRQGRAARIRAHLAACARCAEVELGLADVSRLLAAIPAPAMPERLSERVQAAIAAEAAQRAVGYAESTAGYPGASDPAAVRIPGRPDLPERGRRQRRPWRFPDFSSPLVLRGLAATAAVVVVVGGGLLLANTGGKPQPAPSAQSGASHVKVGGAGSAGLTPVRYSKSGQYVYTDAMTSNVDYTHANLADGIRKAVEADSTTFSGPAETSPMPTVNGSAVRPSKSTTSAKQAHAFPMSQLGACLSRVANGRAVALTQLAHYLHMPVAIIVLEPTGAVFDVIVVGTTCGSSGPDIIRELTVPRI